MSLFKSPNSNFKGHVTPKGHWEVEGTPGTIVVPPNVRWAVKLTLDHEGKWAATSLPAEKTNDPPEFVHMYDSTSASNLVRFSGDSHNIMTAYDDGLFNDIHQAKELFPGRVILTICVKFGDVANFADTEPGNMSKAEAIAMWESHRVDGIYADKSDWEVMLPTVEKSEKDLERHCIKWVADPNPNNVPHIPAWADLCQYGFDGKYDVSLVRYKAIAHLL